VASVVIAKKVDVSADAIWKLISNFGDTSWMPAGTQVTVAGSGVGMERRIAMGPDKSIVERSKRSTPRRARSPTASP